MMNEWYEAGMGSVLNTTGYKKSVKRKRPKSRCISCNVFLEYEDRGRRGGRCKKCASERAKGYRVVSGELEKARANVCAYQYVIRDRYSGELYKWNSVPSGYEEVYKAMPGYLLPRKYKDLKEYVDEK